MGQEYKQDKEHLWLVRYMMKHDLEAGSQCVPPTGNAFFYAINEEALAKQIAGWQHYSQHDGVVVQEIKAVPPDFKLLFYGLLQELPAVHRIVKDVTPYIEDKPVSRRKANRLMCVK